jgi:anti-sigma factor RsiW
MEIEMTRCRAVRKQISAYVDGELPEARAVEVRAHLSRCDECAEYHDDLLALSGLLDLPATVQADEAFTADVLARVHAREGGSTLTRLRRAVWRPMPGWAAAAAVALAIGLGSGLAWMSGPDPTPAPQMADAGVVSQEFGLDAFQPLAEDSVGGAYMQVAWPQGGGAR